MLPLVKSKRDSSAACPGASRKGESAGHSARNDGAVGSPAFGLGRGTLLHSTSGAPGLEMLPPVKSKRDSSTACPGASRKTKSAGHSAQNDGTRTMQNGASFPRRYFTPADYRSRTISDKNQVRRSVWSIQTSIKLAVATSLYFSHTSC